MAVRRPLVATVVVPCGLPTQADDQTPPESLVGWPALVAELQAMARESLGGRATKAEALLANSEQSVVGLEAAIDRVAHVPVVFVDQSRVEELAYSMKARLAARLGQPPPPPPPPPGQPIGSTTAVDVQRSRESRWSWDSMTNGEGCMGNATLLTCAVGLLAWLTTILTSTR